MPDVVVAEQVADPEGVVSEDCLSDKRLASMVEAELLPEGFEP